MSIEETNRLQVFYNDQHKPYLYGAVHIVDRTVDNQRWEKPFIVSKTRPNGQEVVYGTVRRTLLKLQSQLDRIEKFHSASQAKLAAEGISLPTPGSPELPESETVERILDEQEDLLEDVLLAVSVNIRILSEVFPTQLKRRKVNVYDYDDGEVGRIELSKIADLLVHNRYIAIRGHQVVDLMSDEQFMAEDPQMGLKFNVAEYLSEVGKVVSGLTVKDLIGKLWGIVKKLSPSSSVKDIVFLTQNLYTLGGSIVGGASSVNSGPLRVILDKAERQHLARKYPAGPPARVKEVTTQVFFTTPRFYLEPDLNQKQVRTEIQVNGNQETLVMGYEDFFSEVANASGGRSLYAQPGS